MAAAAPPSTNQAAFLTAKQARPLVVGPAPMPTPAPHEVVIRVRATTINPVDAGIQAHGILWTEFPVILGSDVAGEVTAVGSDVAAAGKFRAGDRVLACVETGAHARFVAADAALVARVPAAIGFAAASVLPLCVTTAASSLFEAQNMALRHPQAAAAIDEVRSNGQLVLVWGGASVVGSCAIQMLVAAGYVVAATAGAANAEYVRALGARWVFDYRAPGVVDEIVGALRGCGAESAGVFCAVLQGEAVRDCVAIVERLGGAKVVGTVAPSTMPFDIELPDGVRLGVCNSTADVLKHSIIRDVLKWPGMQGQESQIPAAVFDSWLTAALESGIMKCKPDPQVIGTGLDKIQDGIDLYQKGVSATKLVIEID